MLALGAAAFAPCSRRKVVVRATTRAATPQGISTHEVELQRPLGITIYEAPDESVYVTAVREKAQAAGVAVGDVVVGVSAVFGDYISDIRGKGMAKVESMIRTRPAADVKLRLERGHEYHRAPPEDEFAEFTFEIDDYVMRDIFDQVRGKDDQDPPQEFIDAKKDIIDEDDIGLDAINEIYFEAKWLRDEQDRITEANEMPVYVDAPDDDDDDDGVDAAVQEAIKRALP